MRQVTVNAEDLSFGDKITVWQLNERGHRTWGQGGTLKTRYADTIGIETPDGRLQTFSLADHEIIREVPFDLAECIQYQEGVCHGNVDHFSPNGRGSAPLRCEFHRERRMRSYESSSERFAHSDVAPEGFNASWGGMNEFGERWDED